jgi:hypothetical protein
LEGSYVLHSAKSARALKPARDPRGFYQNKAAELVGV